MRSVTFQIVEDGAAINPRPAAPFEWLSPDQCKSDLGNRNKGPPTSRSVNGSSALWELWVASPALPQQRKSESESLPWRRNHWWGATRVDNDIDAFSASESSNHEREDEFMPLCAVRNPIVGELNWSYPAIQVGDQDARTSLETRRH